MYIIYINEVKLIIAENVPKQLAGHQLLEEKGFSLLDFYQQYFSSTSSAVFLLLSAEPKGLFQSLAKDFKIIEAAGGLVTNAEGDTLFIFRRAKWDLPKGKIDEGETPELAALREVEEECGIQIDELGALLAETYHIFHTSENTILKRTFWYQMSVKNIPELIPQLEEDITEVAWLSSDELAKVKANTYPLILDLIEAHIRS